MKLDFIPWRSLRRKWIFWYTRK